MDHPTGAVAIHPGPQGIYSKVGGGRQESILPSISPLPAISCHRARQPREHSHAPQRSPPGAGSRAEDSGACLGL